MGSPSLQALVVEFIIKPAHIESFAAAILHNARASLTSEPGCRQFDVCTDPVQPGLFFLYELYDDEAAVQAHLASAHFLQMTAATADWVERKTVWRYQRMAPD